MVYHRPGRNGERYCTTCSLTKNKRVLAQWVAKGSDGLQWYECSKHAAEDHPYAQRVERIPLDTVLQQAARLAVLHTVGIQTFDQANKLQVQGERGKAVFARIGE